MCGIAGIFDPTGSGIDQEALIRSGETLRHRGPDDDGIHTDGYIGLVFRRLSIIDLESGAQPMSNEDGTIWLVCNGEIYNFQTLRKELEDKGHRFRSESDSEVILHLYEELGEEFVKRLDGMFGFALWDSKRHVLVLGRDRLGIKPMYYSVRPDGGLLFASELKAILEMPGVERSIDPDALSHYLTFRYVPGEHCIIQGIRKLPAGHTLTIQEGKPPLLSAYWDLAFTSASDRSDREWVDAFDQRLRTAVTDHMVSDVPVGVLLSGGLDSSAIVAYTRDIGVSNLKSFSVAFDVGGEFDERPFARQAAHAFNTDHHEVVISAQDFARDVMDVVWHADEPLADLASVPLFAVSRLAREHVTVVLSGEGSDELFGGYPGVEQILKRADFMKWPRPIRQLASLPIRALPGKSRWARALSGRTDAFARNLGLSMTSVFSRDEKRYVWDGPSTAAVAETFTDKAYHGAQTDDPLNQILYMYAKNWLPDDLLAKADRMTMAHSLELRVPFLDNHLVDFVSGMPQHMKVRREPSTDGWQRKYVLRKALEGRVPQDIIDRPKQGFPVPAYGWLAADLKDFGAEWMKSSHLVQMGFQTAALDSLAASAQSGNARAQKQAWSLIILAIWSDRFLR